MSDRARHLQQLLAGMPVRRPPLSVLTDRNGRQVVVADRAVVLFGPFEAADLGARNLAIVSLTQMGFGVGQTAELFGLRPGTVSELRTAFHRDGAAGVVKVSGRRAKLDEATMTEIRALKAQGWTQTRLAAKYQVTQPAISQALARRAPAHPCDPQAVEEPETIFSHGDGFVPDVHPAGTDLDLGDDLDDEESGRVWGEGVAFGLEPAPDGGWRIGSGVFGCRYAGAMLAYAYTDRAGVGPVLAGLGGAPWRRFDQTQIAAFTTLALLLGISSVEGIKNLIPAQAGPLIGSVLSPGLDVLRPRLSAIADASDVPALQTALATAMLAMPGHTGGVFYVDDHFVPYSGGRPVAMGHNGKRDRCEPGRADTLITDARGRAVCFSSTDPTHLSKTMKPALVQLRQIVPAGKILLGFDRGGAYAEAFTACQDENIDFVTYRRGTLAPTTAVPITHHLTRGRTKIAVTLADEQIEFKDYTGSCRQLSLYEPGPDCTCPNNNQAGPQPATTTNAPSEGPVGAQAHCPHLRLVLQILTSDLTASAPDLLFALKGRWIIENTFKYLDFYGIDWLTDYHADIAVNTKLIDNPARKAANAAIRAAKTAHTDAERALGALLTGGQNPQAKNTALPAAQQAVTDTGTRIKELTAARNQIPVRLPANQINPDARRALQRTHRRGLLMMLRLLAYNTDTWLADHLNVYLQSPNQYRVITRALMHHPGTITYTPEQVTVTLDRHHTPKVNRALTLLLDELNTTPAHLPGDPRPITYQLAT